MTQQHYFSKNIVYGALFATTLLGCSNSDNGNSSQLSENAKLQHVQDSEALANYLKTGLKEAVTANGYIQNRPSVEVTANATPTPGTSGEDQGVSLGFSTTNLVEDGVDEPDNVKFDGKNIYIAAANYDYCIELCPELMPQLGIIPGEPTPGPAPDNAVRVMHVDDPTHSATQIARIQIPLSEKYDNERINGLMLAGNNSAPELVSIMSASKTRAQSSDVATWSSIWNWVQGATIIDTFDISQPTQSIHQNRIDIDGYLVASRRIDNQLYVVTRFTPTVNTVGVPDQIRRDIDAMTLEQLLPTITIDGETSPLVDASNCFIYSAAAGYPTLLVVTTISLIDHAVSSSCVTANLSDVYVSKNSIYLSENDWSDSNAYKTHIYKFDLDENGSHYSSQGVVQGELASNSNFSINEYDHVLRVVTHDWSADVQTRNRLYTLQDDGNGSLKILATLPNDQHPATFGKSNEQIEGVRFIGDHAYVVTFLRIDPLYVVDLSDPRNPFIAGEVEIPGFSSLLQPLQNNLLLGIGTENNALKAELYDVANANNPIPIGKYILNDDGMDYSSSPASWNHHALSLLTLPDNTVRIALPFYGSQYINDVYSAYKGVLSLLVDANARTLQPVAKALVSAEDYATGDQRVVLHDNTLHYIEGSQIRSGAWGSNDPLSAQE